jgi:hypothetical protein
MKKLTKSKLIQIIKEEIENVKLGSNSISRSTQAAAQKKRAKDISSGASLGGITNKERAILQDVEKFLTKIAEKDDLAKYKGALQAILKKMMGSTPDPE